MKYPRYFIYNKDKLISTLLYACVKRRFGKIWYKFLTNPQGYKSKSDKTYWVKSGNFYFYRPYHPKLFHLYSEPEADEFVKNKIWKEVSKEELALML